MDIKVRVLVNNKPVAESDLSKIQIKNPSIDRIVNEVVSRNNK